MRKNAQKLNIEQLITEILLQCSGKKFLYIVGHGGSGKSTLAEKIAETYAKEGKVCNVVSMDDFVVDTTLRKKAQYEDGGYYTTCCKESYFLPAIEMILASLQKGMDCFYQPKRKEKILLDGQAQLHIVEGIGTVFLPKTQETFVVELSVDGEEELKRRIAREKNRQTGRTQEVIEKSFETRNKQYHKNILPLLQDIDLKIKAEPGFVYSLK